MNSLFVPLKPLYPLVFLILVNVTIIDLVTQIKNLKIIYFRLSFLEA